MILAETAESILDLGIPGIQYLHDQGRMPYESMIISTTQKTPSYIYGDGEDNGLAYKRLMAYLGRPCRDITSLPKLIRSKKCGACHEVSGAGCSAPMNCDFSLGNIDCFHTDNAAIFPFLESVVYVLYCGKYLSQNDFFGTVAWMRILAQKKMNADILAKHPKLKNNKRKFDALFGRSGPMKSHEFDVENVSRALIERNSTIQTVLGNKMREFLPSCFARIALGVNAQLDLADTPPNSDIGFSIAKRIQSMDRKFWTSTPFGVG